MTTLTAELPTDLDISNAKWIPFTGSPKFDYHIDYAFAITSVDLAAQRIDFLVKWAPNAFCHYHRHLGETTAFVIQGEQHLTETREFETVTKVRQVGFSGQVPDGDSHMECAGPDGLTMLFRVHAPDGQLFETLDKDGNVLAASTLEGFVAMANAATA